MPRLAFVLALPFALAVLAPFPALAASPTPLCQPEPRESPDKEALWNRYLGQLAGLSRNLPAKPDAKLLMPVQGVQVRQVADTWGAPRGGGFVHAGQDIFARKGTPVHSATAGIVWRISQSPRGGTWVYVLGAGGRRYYYAHLNTVARGLREGQRVTTDTLIGTVGSTGEAETTPPHLHFGVFTKYEPGAKCRFGAINPLPLMMNRASDSR